MRSAAQVTRELFSNASGPLLAEQRGTDALDNTVGVGNHCLGIH